MYEQQIQNSLFYTMLYGAAAMLALTACCYLLFRRANAIAPDVTSPVRLRRWTAAFFASMTLSHLWYLPVAFCTSSEEILQSYLVGAILDFMTLIPCAIVLLLVMLQDRRRPLWPVGVMVAPVIIGLAACLVYNNIDFMPLFYGYHLLMAVGLLIYMVRATRQYGHWLRDNYADLEHKEVWQSLAVLAIILLVFGLYAFSTKSMTYKYLSQLNCIILICYLLWRVETLSDLSDTISRNEERLRVGELCSGMGETRKGFSRNEENSSSLLLPPSSEAHPPAPPPSHSSADNIGPLLKQYCEEPRLYLQYDISVAQLAKLIGTNRVYLSKYFAMQGSTYNAYINGLRIQHFVQLYHEAVAAGQPVIAKQLAYQSGFRSYSTFSAVFKQTMGTTVTAWMNGMTE